MIEIDDFLGDFSTLDKFKDECEYTDVVSPVDGVVYPYICKDLPQSVIHDIIFNLTFKVLSREPEDPFIFLRKSPEGVHVPHKYHTDNSMGAYSMMIYLQDIPNAGTGLAQHKELKVHEAPSDEYQLRKTIEDCNDDSKWQIYKVAEMKKNKAVIFNSQLFHVALPIGGFGEGKEARTVLTCFFS